MSKPPVVIAVCRSPGHTMAKPRADSIRLIEGIGIEGDAHAGTTVKHRSRAAKDPTLPNLRQVHLMHAELFGELGEKGFTVSPGQIGENITTSGLDLLALPLGTRLQLGDAAVVELTGLRNPCSQLDGIREGLMEAVLERRPSGLVRKSGVMAIVTAGGEVRAGDPIRVILPPEPHAALKPV
jgi:MOSC domain-containing protein YiiM